MATINTHTALPNGRVRNDLPTADEFAVDCVNVWPAVTLDEADPVLRADDWLAIAHEPFGEHVEVVDYIPANIPA